jgi:MFS family permease
MLPLRRLVLRALITPDYARLWFGQAVSTLGDAVFSTTLVLWVGTALGGGKPWAPAAVSGVLVAVGSAVLVAGPLAGVLVDRWDCRRVALVTEVVRAALAGILAAVSFIPVRELPTATWLALIYLFVFALNVSGQFFQPARMTLIRDIMPGEVDRARAAGIGQATSETMTIIGPPLAAPLMFGIGLQWALLFNSVSYLVSFFAVRSVSPGAPEAVPDSQRHEQSGLRAEFVAGLRFFRGNRILMTLLPVAVIAQCGITPLDTLNVFFLTANLHASSHLYGYLGMALGVGGVTGALCAGYVVRRFGTSTVTWAGVSILGILLIVYSRQTSFVAGLVLLFLLALPMGMAVTAFAPLLLEAAPREFVGRTMAVFNPVNQLSGMLTTVVAGWLLSSVLRNFDGSLAGVRLGPIDLIFLASGGLILVAGLYARTALRRAVAATASATNASAGETAVPDQAVLDAAGGAR